MVIHNAHGQPVRLIGAVTDITERKQTEEQPRASHDTFRQLVKNSPFGIYVIDADFPLAQVGAGAQKVFEATGQPYHAPGTIERRQDIGEVEACDWKIERITLPDRCFGVVCHFYDLSERQRFEAALRQSGERLRLATEAADWSSIMLMGRRCGWSVLPKTSPPSNRPK